MPATNKIGFDYEVLMNETSEKWESPEDIISYVRAGINFLAKTNGSMDTEVIEKRNRWINYMKSAMDCLMVID